MANSFDAMRLTVQAVYPTNDVLMDDKGMPSFMVYIPAFRLCDVLSTSDTSVHPAFKVNGKQIPGFYVGKYQTKKYNGRAYSLPAQVPTAAQTYDQVRNQCTAKGTGWHEMTNAEFAALALWCHKNGCAPRGNNKSGKDERESTCVAVPSASSGTTTTVLTGTGPVTWSHNGQRDGIFDLNGNVWEWVTGLRIVYGEVQVLADNNAAVTGADLAANSAEWKAIRASDGALVTPNGSGTTAGTVKLDWVNSAWRYTTTITNKKNQSMLCEFKNVTADSTVGAAAKLLLQALAMLPDTALTGSNIDANYGGNGLWVNNGLAECCATRGGDWTVGTKLGVFALYLSDPRTATFVGVGGRCNYVAQ